MRHGRTTGLLLRLIRSLDGPRRARAARPSVQVLAYHAIADLPAGSAFRKYSVPPAEFAAQLDTMLRIGYRFVDLGALLAGLNGTRPLPERAALVTFDDCYEDLRTVAAPILTARGIPAVAFAVAGRLGETNDWDAAPEGERLRLLDGKGLRSLGRLGIEVGAHSLTHPALTAISVAELSAEVARCRQRLESAGLGAPRVFAYPYGRSNAEVVAAVRDAGFAAAFTTRSGLVTASSDRYRLPRVEVHRGDTGLRLRLRLAAARAPGPLRAAMDRIPRPARDARRIVGYARGRITAPGAAPSSTPPSHVAH